MFLIHLLFSNYLFTIDNPLNITVVAYSRIWYFKALTLINYKFHLVQDRMSDRLLLQNCCCHCPLVNHPARPPTGRSSWGLVPTGSGHYLLEFFFSIFKEWGLKVWKVEKCPHLLCSCVGTPKGITALVVISRILIRRLFHYCMSAKGFTFKVILLFFCQTNFWDYGC